MSPTEDDLRSALSDGAGDVPNVDRIVFAGQEQRVQRRKRVLSVAAAVVLVGALGAGGTYLAQQGSSTTSASRDYGSSSTGGTRAAAGAANGAEVPAPSEPSAAGSATASGAGTTCPAHVPGTMLPGGGGTTQFGSTGPIFAHPVDTVTVCAYLSGLTSGAPSTVRLAGSDATTFAASLENAARSRSDRACPDYRMADQKTLEIIATTASGTQLPTVTSAINEPACAVVVTNGTAVRYGWSWPTSLQSQLAELGSGTSGSASGSVAPLH